MDDRMGGVMAGGGTTEVRVEKVLSAVLVPSSPDV